MKIIAKLYWKDKEVLDILMKQALEIKDLETEANYKKMLTLFRNDHVSRMVSFIGHKYSGHYFLHQIALKPFYAASSKITIFYLS